jgi:hypothetical protein
MNFLKAAALVIAGLLPLATTMAPASATTQTYDWTLIAPPGAGGFTAPGSGTLTATISAMGGDPVTAITGTVGGNAIAGLIPDFFGDNLVFPNSNGTSLLSIRMAFPSTMS